MFSLALIECVLMRDMVLIVNKIKLNTDQTKKYYGVVFFSMNHLCKTNV